MASNYLYPTISSLPAGYDCAIVLPLERIAERLLDGNGRVSCDFAVYFNGETVSENKVILDFEDGVLRGPPPTPFVWKDAGDDWNGETGFLELTIQSPHKQAIFNSKRVIGFYSIYSKPGKKSFFSDNAYKMAAPPVINQIAAYGRYVDGYPVVHIDRDKDLGETLTLINPYKKPVLVEVRTCKGRRLPRTRVAPHSAALIRMEKLLGSDERLWIGQIQVTANNRLVTYHLKHSLRDPRVISDHEHLDTYRGEATHLPATRWLRQAVGNLLLR